mgnify:CR=1 FL=1|tara:strand:- start:117 stop:806 length:690 start_codon:yes stop_codon:yes gene_type:complete
MKDSDNFKHKFVWEKVNTPTEDYQHGILYQDSEKNAEDMVDPDDLEEMVEDAYEEEVYVENKVPIQLIQALMEQNKYEESFEFWILHTNFDIRTEIEKVIQNTAGVESFQKLTRYRVKVGLTKSGLFNNRSVKLCIQQNLTDYFKESSTEDEGAIEDFFDTETQEEIERIKDELSLSSEMWSMFVFPNGAISKFKHASEEDMLKKIIFLSEVKSILGGRILSSGSAFGV